MSWQKFLIEVGLSLLLAAALKIRAWFNQERLSWWLALPVALIVVFAGGWVTGVYGR